MVSGLTHKKGKKRGGKQDLVFAKNPKQATLAAIVLIVFAISTFHLLVKSSSTTTGNKLVLADASNTAGNTNVASTSLQDDKSSQQTPITPVTSQTTDSTLTQAQDANNIYSQTVSLQGHSPTVASSVPINPGEEIEIIPRKASKNFSIKKVAITVDNSSQQNPFLPSSDNISRIASASKLSYLTAPPEILPFNTEASKVMTTTISGILYDKYSPSAIINIEGTDYLVKKGDIINHYKILSIGKTQVLVQLGKNIYSAGVGELLAPTDINYNTIANLDKKFGGNDVSINVRKKVINGGHK